MHILWSLIIGLVVGALAKLFMPGKDPGGVIITMLLGIAGSLVAGFIGRALGWYQSGRADRASSRPSSAPWRCWASTGCYCGAVTRWSEARAQAGSACRSSSWEAEASQVGRARHAAARPTLRLFRSSLPLFP